MNTAEKTLSSWIDGADAEWYKSRLARIGLLVVAAFLVLFFRLLYLQVIEGPEYHRLSENNCIRLQPIVPSRGLIFDRNGEVLVDNRPSYDVSVVIRDAKPLDRTLDNLAYYLQVSAFELKEKIDKAKGHPTYRPLPLKVDIGRDALAMVEAHRYELPGIQMDVKSRREYLQKQSAAHLIGYLGEISAEELKCAEYAACRQGDLIGKFGVEKSLESYLQGRRGGRQVEVDARGQVVRVLRTVDAEPGHNVYLSLDHRLQERAEALMAHMVGAAVVMDAVNGQVLAMANSPSFDQNIFITGLSRQQWQALSNNPVRPLENKAIQAEYPPASTYKIITALAGLEEKVIDENTTFFCPGGFQFGDRFYRCWKKGGHGTVNVVGALEESCDVFFYQTGLRLGVDRIAHYAKVLGLGTPTGIALDHEAKGLIPTSDWKKRRFGSSWHKGETLSIAIGQGYNLATPLQMAVATAAVGNGGRVLKPELIQRIESAGGRTVLESQTVVRQQLQVRPEVLEAVRKGLWRVVNGSKGTAGRSRIEGLAYSGKTGTAQVFGRRPAGNGRKESAVEELKSHAWFVAYAPAEKPRIAVAVIVEHGEHGSTAAAPVAAELIRAYFFPDRPARELFVEPLPEEQEDAPDVIREQAVEGD